MRTAWLLGIALAAATLLACEADGGGGESAPASKRASAGSGPAPVANLLVTAIWEDLNQSGAPDGGDELRLGFTQTLDGQRVDPHDIVPLAVGDGLGISPRFAPTPPSPQLRLVLGQGAQLTLFDTYIPNDQPNLTPAVLVLAGALAATQGGPGTPVRLVASPQSRPRFFGDAYPVVDGGAPRYGSLHAHTGFSDGEDTPAIAADHARRNGLDFFAVTDHLEQILFPSNEYGDTGYMLDQRDAPGQFVTLRGYEWGGGPESVIPFVWSNHINVIDDPTLMRLVTDRRSFYRELASRPTDVIGQFNHPGDRSQGTVDVDLFGDFLYDAPADTRMRLIRTEPGQHDDHVGYQKALDKGWHLSPSASEDDHRRNWGSASSNRTGVWTTALTRAEVLRALREMRTFTTSDGDASIRAEADGRWMMGSTLAGAGAHTFTVIADDRSGDGFDRLELVSLGGQVVDRHDAAGSATVTWSVTVDPTGDRWYYARAIQRDGDKLYAAPFFVDQ